MTSTFTLRGRRCTYGTGALVAQRVPVGAAASRVAGVALGDIHRFAWQAWRLVTSTFTLRGRRGTYGTGRALGGLWWRSGFLAWQACTGGALGGLWWCSGFPWAPRRLAWQAWHLATSTFVLPCRRGTG